jgi:serine/threonine-protein kinase
MSGDPDAPEESDRTIFMPAAEAQAESGATTETEATRRIAAAPQPPRTQVSPGSILNNIYEVKRFLARGGMGEVYEGFNINSDERVAIKVMLPSLAADPNVQAMFRKEARTLTRLNHPAVVQYRVLAQEPSLGVYYIVTEFIDGAPLSDLLPTLQPTKMQLKALTRRLAEGLGAAHALGAVHRDMAPDNVLLPEGRIDLAKIIDFGISKDLDPSKGTIIGDGFAGKLSYVAPEQFGAYDRQVGPWTDVYSLGLVVLAAALGRDVDMGGTLVEAIDKRRAGPDLNPIPPELRPVFTRMLAANPAERLRSMEDVVAALDQSATATQVRARSPQKPAEPKRKTSPLPLIVAGASVAVVVAGVSIFLTVGKKPAGGAPPAAAAAPAVRTSVEQTLPVIGCSWLEVGDFESTPAGVTVRLKGVAGRPAAAQTSISTAVTRAGGTLADLNLDEVAPVGEALCAPLDVFRPLRAEGADLLSLPQRKFEITMQPDTGKKAARAVIDMHLPDPKQEVALVGLEPNGKMTVLIKTRADLDKAVAAGAITDQGGGVYRLQVDTDHTGWSGMLLITGKEAVAPALVEGDAAVRGADWPESFRNAATQGGWKTDMVWYRTVRAAAG